MPIPSSTYLANLLPSPYLPIRKCQNISSLHPLNHTPFIVFLDLIIRKIIDKCKFFYQNANRAPGQRPRTLLIIHIMICIRLSNSRLLCYRCLGGYPRNRSIGISLPNSLFPCISGISIIFNFLLFILVRNLFKLDKIR